MAADGERSSNWLPRRTRAHKLANRFRNWPADEIFFVRNRFQPQTSPFRMKLPSCLFVLLVLLSGCSSVDTQVESTTDLRRFHHVYVRSASNDSNNIDQLIVLELQRLGYDASSGPRTMMPDNAEIVIEYEGQWDWDFRTYLLQLSLTVRDVRTEAKLAGGRIFHPGVTRKTPAELVHLILAPLFGPHKAK
jgi:hypothetical protein